MLMRMMMFSALSMTSMSFCPSVRHSEAASSVVWHFSTRPRRWLGGKALHFLGWDDDPGPPISLDITIHDLKPQYNASIYPAHSDGFLKGAMSVWLGWKDSSVSFDADQGLDDLGLPRPLPPKKVFACARVGDSPLWSFHRIDGLWKIVFLVGSMLWSSMLISEGVLSLYVTVSECILWVDEDKRGDGHN